MFSLLFSFVVNSEIPPVFEQRLLFKTAAECIRVADEYSDAFARVYPEGLIFHGICRNARNKTVHMAVLVDLPQQ